MPLQPGAYGTSVVIYIFAFQENLIKSYLIKNIS